MPQRLGTIYRGVRELIEQFQPSEVAIEEVFWQRTLHLP